MAATPNYHQRFRLYHLSHLIREIAYIDQGNLLHQNRADLVDVMIYDLEQDENLFLTKSQMKRCNTWWSLYLSVSTPKQRQDANVETVIIMNSDSRANA